MDSANLLAHVIAGSSLVSTWCLSTFLRWSFQRWSHKNPSGRPIISDSRPYTYRLFQQAMLLLGCIWVLRAFVAFMSGVDVFIGGYTLSSQHLRFSLEESYWSSSKGSSVFSYVLFDVILREASWIVSILLWPYPTVAIFSVAFHTHFIVRSRRFSLSFFTSTACITLALLCVALEIIDEQICRILAFWVLFVGASGVLVVFIRFSALIRDHHSWAVSLGLVWQSQSILTAMSVRMVYLSDR